MPTINRQDGVKFAINTYREFIERARPAVLRQQLYMLAKNHGEYIRLFPQEGNQYEAVFSRDPGFLLGESVWEYFGKPKNLVFCEQSIEPNYATVVVVRNDRIYLDTRLPFNSIPDEFASLLTGEDRYQINVYGDVPVSEQPAPGCFTFDARFVDVFNVLNAPIIGKLPTNENLQLQPIDQAIRAMRLGRKSKTPLMIVVIVILILLSWWMLKPTKTEEIVMPTTKQVSPWQAFENAMQTPSPQQQLDDFANKVLLFADINGWQLASLNLNQGTYSATVTSFGGSMEGLLNWAQANKVTFALSNNGVNLSLNAANLPNRPVPTTIPVLQTSLTRLYDAMNRLLPTAGGNNALSVEQTNVDGSTRTVTVTINFQDVSPVVLELIGRELINYPVKLDSIDATVSNDVLSGKIKLSVVGK